MMRWKTEVVEQVVLVRWGSRGEVGARRGSRTRTLCQGLAGPGGHYSDQREMEAVGLASINVGIDIESETNTGRKIIEAVLGAFRVK